MQTYADMKDSGVAWLGRIPAEWQKRRAKFIFQKVQQPPREEDEVVTAFRDGEVVLRSLRREDGFTFASKEIGYQHVSKGDLVIHAMDAFAGAIGVSKSDGKMSPVCSICQPVDDSTSTQYYSYLLRAMTKTNYLVAIAKGIRERSTDFRYSDFGNMLLPLPTSSQQQKIADFLDTETAQIDNLITKQERLLELLEEKRRATITHAVTRGLDPSVELKETNIPWLGQIPSHWEVMTLKRLLRLPVTDGPHETPNFKDSGVPFLSVDGIQDGELDLINVRYISEEDHSLYSRKALVERGDILMGKAASTGKIAQVKTDTKFSIWSPLAILKFNPNINIDFIEYVLKSDYIQYHIDILCTNNTQKNISMRDIPRLIVGIPPQSEQLDIVNFVQDRERKAAALRGKIQTQITLLRERRTSLISHAVTGKVKIT